MKNRKNRVRNSILSFIVLTSMILAGCSSLFGGEIKGGTKMDKFFDEFGNIMNLKQSTRGNIDLRLNFDGEYEGSKYASSYLDAFYIARDLSNSTDDLTYFQMLDFRDDYYEHYTVYCYQTHPYNEVLYEDRNGKIMQTRSDDPIVIKADETDAYVMYPEIIVEPEIKVDENTLVTVLAVYDYTEGGASGYKEIGRWTTPDNQADSYVFAKTIYGNDFPTNYENYYVSSYCVCAAGYVMNYMANNISEYARNVVSSVTPPFKTDLNEAFKVYLKSKDMAKTDLAKAKDNDYEIEIYNVSGTTDEDGTILYIDMTASTTKNSRATKEDDELVAKYDQDDYDGSEDGEDYEELSEEEAEAEAQEFQKLSGSWDFVACVVDKDMGDLEIFGGPITQITNDKGQTKENLYWVKYAGEVKRIHGIRAVIANKPELGSFRYLIDHNGNAPFPIMALYETNNVFDHEWDKEIDGDVCTEYDWKKIVNEDCYEDYADEWYGSEDEYLKELQDDDEDYVTAYNIEKTYYTMLEEKSALLDYGLGRTFEAPATTKESPLLYNGVKPDGGSENYVKFPMKLTGKLKINASPLSVAAVRKSGSSGRYYFPLTLEDAHVSGVVFNNTDSAENKFQFVNDDYIVGWERTKVDNKYVDRIYGVPKSISENLWFPDNFSDIYKYPLEEKETSLGFYDSVFSYASGSETLTGAKNYMTMHEMVKSVPHLGEGENRFPVLLGKNAEPYYDGFAKKLESVDFANTDNGGYLLAVAPGYVEAAKASSGFNTKEEKQVDIGFNIKKTVYEDVEPEVFKIDTSKFAQSVSEVTESELTFNAQSSDEAMKFWNNNAVTKPSEDGTGDDRFSYNFSSDDGVSAGVVLLTAVNGSDTIDITAIIASDGIYFYENGGGLLQDPISYDVADKALVTDSISELQSLGITNELILNNWSKGGCFKEEITANLRYRYKISFSDRKDGGATVKIEDISKDNYVTLTSFTISKQNAIDGKVKSITETKLSKIKQISELYYESISNYISDSIQVSSRTYTKYKVKSSFSPDALGAENITLKSGTFDGINSGEWWTCTTALYGMGFQMKENTDVYYIPTFQRIQHTLNTNAVYDPEKVYLGNSENLSTEVVSLDGGIACYGIYKNVNSKENSEYPYVFLGFDNQGNVYTEMEMVRAKIIPFGYTNKSFEKKTYVNNTEVSRLFEPSGSDSVIYYLKDSFVNRNGQEIVYNGDYDPDAELDKITGKVTAYVYNKANLGVPDITFNLYQGDTLIKSSITDGAGFALLRHIPEGKYEIYANSLGVDFATFLLDVGEKGKINSIECFETLDCTAKTKIVGTNQVDIKIEGFEGVDPEDAITGRLYGYIYNSKGKPVSNVYAKVEGPKGMEATTDKFGSFFMRKLPEGDYKVTLMQKDIEFAYFALKVGYLGRIQSFEPIEVYDVSSYDLSFYRNSAKMVLYGFDGATDRNKKPDIEPVKPTRESGNKDYNKNNGKDKDKNKGKVNDDRTKLTKPTNLSGDGSISDKIDEFLGEDISGNELDVSGANLDLSGLKLTGEGFDVQHVPTFGDEALSALDKFLEWLKEHLGLLLLILILIILIIVAYVTYRKKNGQPVIPDKVKDFFWKINIFKNINFKEIFKFKKK